MVRIKIVVSAAFDMRIKIKPKGQRYIYEILDVLTLKAPNKIAAGDILILYFYLSKKESLIFHVNPLPSRGLT